MYKKTKAIIKNALCEERIDDVTGEVLSYRIYPKKGYKLHEISLDAPIIDEETLTETDQKVLGFTSSFVTAGKDYDFKENPRQIYAEKEDEI